MIKIYKVDLSHAVVIRFSTNLQRYIIGLGHKAKNDLPSRLNRYNNKFDWTKVFDKLADPLFDWTSTKKCYCQLLLCTIH